MYLTANRWRSWQGRSHNVCVPGMATLCTRRMVSARVSIAGQQPATFDKTEYQKKCRNLVKLVNQLRDAGAHSSFTLPSLVVCGNQSAGKSSLLERLCGVKLPRAAGTCTKCPTEVCLSTAPPGGNATWCCQVKLRKEYDRNNTKLPSKPKEQEFKTLDQDSKELLHFYVSAAQRALLNPDSPADTFIRDADRASTTGSSSTTKSYDVDPEDDLRFTRNVVVLEITGADVDLALIDLPGIIQTEQGDDGANVELVKQLVEQYISSDRSIIVATITCKDDIDNQAIVQMAHSADREGLRTIGVLTKADTIEPGTHGNWLRVLQGQNYPLRLGYFCVVNPSQEDINNGMTPEAAAAKELDFFRQDGFFSSEAVAAMRGRFGVDTLRVQLSKQLVSLTQRELPKMKAALEDALAQTEMQLRNLPPPPAADPSFELFRRLRDLARAVEQAVDGKDDAAFFRAVDTSYRQFREAVLEVRPCVRLIDLPGAGNRSNVIVEEPHPQRAASPAVVDASNATTESTLHEEDPEFWLQGPTLEGEEEPQGLITLDNARQLAAKYRAKELPSFVSYRVLEELIQGLKGRWDAAALTCLQSVSEALQEITDRAVEQHFGQFAVAKKEIRAEMYRLHERLMVNTSHHIKELMAMEQEQSWTQNDHYFVSSKQCFEELLVKQLYGNGKVSNADDVKLIGSDMWTAKGYVNSALANLLQAGFNVSAEDLDITLARKQQKGSEQEGLLGLIAGTLAYYKVSSKRVIDGVPMHLRHYLLKQYCKELSDLPVHVAAGTTAAASISDTFVAAKYTNPLHSNGGSGIGGVTAHLSSSDGVEDVPLAADQSGRNQNTVAPLQNAKALMAEDPTTAERRKQLHRQLEQLHSVRMLLDEF